MLSGEQHFECQYPRVHGDIVLVRSADSFRQVVVVPGKLGNWQHLAVVVSDTGAANVGEYGVEIGRTELLYGRIPIWLDLVAAPDPT